MAKVTITIEDVPETHGIKVTSVSTPDYPDSEEDLTNAQCLGLDIMEAIMANATDIEEHSLN